MARSGVGLGAVRSPPAVPVFTVPAGSNSISDTSASAFGQCSTPRGTTRNSPSPIRTVLSRNCMSKAPCSTRNISSSASCECQTNSPWNFTSLTCWPFSSPTIFGWK